MQVSFHKALRLSKSDGVLRCNPTARVVLDGNVSSKGIAAVDAAKGTNTTWRAQIYVPTANAQKSRLGPCAQRHWVPDVPVHTAPCDASLCAA